MLKSETPNPIVPDIVEQVRLVMNEFTEVHAFRAAFSDIIIRDPDLDELNNEAVFDQLKKIFCENAHKDGIDFGLKHLISLIGSLQNEHKVHIMMGFLLRLINLNLIPTRLTCEFLLASDKLVIKNTAFWLKTFELIRKVIESVDYKGVREIMKTCLEKLGSFPVEISPRLEPLHSSVLQLVEHIFDRSNCLLPAYFIVNEVLKSHPENKNFPHWKVNKLLWDFVDSFRPVAQMVSVIGRSKMLPVVEHSIHAGYLTHSWKLDPSNLRFVLKGNLPYDKELLQPQVRLLRYVLEQPYSRDMACAIIGLQKQHKMRCVALEERIVELIVIAMERTEAEMSLENGVEEISSSTLWLWQHLSTQLIFFVLFQFALFPTIVTSLHEKLTESKLFKGRDFLMWILLQFISGSIQKNPLCDFMPVLQLYDLLYPEREALAVPDITKPYCTSQMASTCIWIHVLKKAQTDSVPLPRPLPSALKKHYEFLQMLLTPSTPQLHMNDFRIALLCNAFSTNQEHFSRPMAALVEAIHGSTQGSSTTTSSPLSVQVLDSLTVHTKMSLIHNIVTHIMKVASTKSTSLTLAAALIETYARLLVYMEIESLGIKGFISQLLPAVYKSQAWGILHTLLEMFCYRLHHIQPHYRVQLLCHLNSLASTAHMSVAQLHLCVEMTALRIITGFNSVDVHSQLSRVVTESKSLVSTDSEELNRALVLTIARAIHVTGADSVTGSGGWFRDILSLIMQNTPHNWSASTIQCFPPVLAEYFQQNQGTKENKSQLKNMVEEEYRNWNSMLQNETELVEHFSMLGTPPLFLCIVFKMILEKESIHPAAYKILDKIGPKGLSAHLRKLCDFFMHEIVSAGKCQPLINKMTDSLIDLVWKYNVVPFDRLLLCLALRTYEGNETQVCFYIIHILMIKPVEFRTRIQEFVKENSPEHWKQTNWHEKHKLFNTKFPEVFLTEEQNSIQLPVYFGNICLRFLPVFDIVIHRFLEINTLTKSLELILEHTGALYKFHDRPITYLYNTLHYYESRLRDKVGLKKKLIGSIIGSLKDIKPPHWALSETYTNYLATPDSSSSSTDSSSSPPAPWTPESEHYVSLIARFVDVIEGNKKIFCGVDWRYNEFPNPAAHVLHSTCVEIMGLPATPSEAANALLDIISQGRAAMSSSSGEGSGVSIESWLNGTGLILVSLPDPYWLVLHERLVSCVGSLGGDWPYSSPPLRLFDFKTVQASFLYAEYANLLAITHALWHHLGTGHIHHVLLLVTEGFLPVVKNEIQLLFICHLLGPFLQRFNGEKPGMVCRLTVALYDLLSSVDRETPLETELEYMSEFCDLLYHIKYMYTGDIVKSDVEGKIKNLLRPQLRRTLRFITHLSMEDIAQPTTNFTTQSNIGSSSMNIQNSTSAPPPANPFSSTATPQPSAIMIA